MKLVHVQSLELLDCMCKEISSSNEEQRKKSGVYSAIFCSVERGNFKFIFGIVKAYPDLVWSRDDDSKSIFSLAVLYRQAKIFSLIYGLAVKKSMTSWVDKKNNNILHMAGMTGASILLNRIPGAALQMQRELQWFKVTSLLLDFSHILSLLTARISTLKTKLKFSIKSCNFFKKILMFFIIKKGNFAKPLELQVLKVPQSVHKF